MPPINLPPTRSNLIRVRLDLQFAREGYRILDQKRMVLAKELVRLAADAEKLEVEMGRLTAAAYLALEKARLTMGHERVEWAALAVNKTTEVHLKYRGVMGISLPLIEASGKPLELAYSLSDTTAALDEASSLFREVLSKLPELSRLVTSVWRLAMELRKTQRRVNALQYIFIPNYAETISFIQGALEERERAELFRLKLLKSRAKRPAPPVAEEPSAPARIGDSA